MRKTYSDKYKFGEKVGAPRNFRETDQGIIYYKQNVYIGGGREIEVEFAKFSNNEYRKNGNLQQSEIPYEFRNKLLKDYKPERYLDRTKAYKALEIAKAYVKNFEKMEGYGLYIYSSTEGTGKSLLASCIGNELIDRYGTTVKFFTVTDLMATIKREMNSKEDPYRRKDSFETALKVPLLIIDNLGGENTTPWISETIQRIVANRRNLGLSTIYTSQKTGVELKYEKTTCSIINEKTKKVLLPEESIREGLAKYEKEKFDKLLEG